MSLRQRIKYKLLDMAHDDLWGGRWHKHHDLLEYIAYRWFS